MYDATLGRYLQRDPSGFRDGTGLYEYALAAPTGRVDPTGLEVKPKTKMRIRVFGKGSDYVQADTYLFQTPVTEGQPGGQWLHDLVRDLENANLLKEDNPFKCVELNQYYIDRSRENDPLEIIQFAQHAGRHKTCSISLFFGHGIGGSLPAPLIPPPIAPPDLAYNLASAAAAAVYGQQGQANIFVLGVVKEKLSGLAGTGEKEKAAPRVGFYSCFSGDYNQVVPSENRLLSGGATEAINSFQLLSQFSKDYKQLRETVGDMCKKCEKVIFNIYWGTIEKRRN